ncbi:hypothetical protein GOP47_0030999 [Adiantum capillus-veneris]|nr:hypothetical protein GOP47_0030999 [Adiantum capillus-veneris]
MHTRPPCLLYAGDFSGCSSLFSWTHSPIAGPLCGASKPSVDLLGSFHELSQSLSEALGTPVLSPRATPHEPSLANSDLAIGPPLKKQTPLACNCSAFKSPPL